MLCKYERLRELLNIIPISFKQERKVIGFKGNYGTQSRQQGCLRGGFNFFGMFKFLG